MTGHIINTISIFSILEIPNPGVKEHTKYVFYKNSKKIGPQI